jgi:hypothetical protein
VTRRASALARSRTSRGHLGTLASWSPRWRAALRAEGVSHLDAQNGPRRVQLFTVGPKPRLDLRRRLGIDFALSRCKPTRARDRRRRDLLHVLAELVGVARRRLHLRLQRMRIEAERRGRPL